MLHLKAMVSNTINYEAKPEATKKYAIEKPPQRDGERLAYMINGFWYYLTINMWLNHADTNYARIRGRYHTLGKTIGQALGFEAMPPRITPGRPRKIKR